MNFVEGEYISMKDLPNYTVPCLDNLDLRDNENILIEEMGLKGAV